VNGPRFLDLCRTAEAVRATTKRLEKAAILGVYFSELPDDDLVRAARYISGSPFPLHDARTTSVGGAALMTALRTATGADDAALRTRLVALGDIGDVAEEVYAADPTLAAREPAFKLADVEEAVSALARTNGTSAKVALLTAALRRAAPLEAKYLLKLLQGDLRIGLREGAVEDALARLSGIPVAEIQWANMLTGDLGETALLARNGLHKSVRMRLFHPLKFMLATPADSPAEVARQLPTPFVVEDKFDGIRAQAHVGRGENGQPHVALFSRTLDDITMSFPDLVRSLIDVATAHPDGAILDGEIVPVSPDDPGVILPFQTLQSRLGRKVVTPEMQAAAPVGYVAYDALYADERVLIQEPFSVRRAALESLLPVTGTVRIAASRLLSDVADLDAEFEQSRARGNEGLMVKDPASTYKPGRRGRDWLKIKRALATLDVVVTAVQVGEGRRAKFLSDYTFAVRAGDEDPTLLNIGKAYSGLTDAEVGELSEWFRAHTLQEFAHGKVRIVEPAVVIEVTFDRVQPSARHKSGFALRFPRIVRIRTDKSPRDIDTMDTVRTIYDSLRA
jgi:DNA ligase-1